MDSVPRNPGVIYKWSSFGTPKPRARRCGEKETTEGYESAEGGRTKKRIVGYRELGRERS